MTFETDYDHILARIHQVNPVRYTSTRNYLDGAVTHLSPYISRGVISTKQVLEIVLANGYHIEQIEKFVQELAWRDYWQQVWISHGSNINDDLRRVQPKASRAGIPVSILHHHTGIEAIDNGIKDLYQTGYIHNHLRMYIASMACNMAQCHWRIPAQWMYYHLLDADWASNALSWQWVSGANSQKLYYANQENINKYTRSNQRQTFLDIGYEAFEDFEIPSTLKTVEEIELVTPLPQTEIPILNPKLPTLIYNFYNLDPQWRNHLDANRILLLEPSVFKNYPVSQQSIQFCISLAKNIIPNIQIWVAEFYQLQQFTQQEIYFKEHPLNLYKGIQDSRDWLSNAKGDFPSFFAFWKKCKKDVFA